MQIGKTSHTTSVLDMTLNNLMVSFSNAGALENVEYPFIAITPRSTLLGVVAPDRVLSMLQRKLFDI